MKNIYVRFGTCLLSKLSIPRLHDEDVSTIVTHRPTKTVLQKEPYLQKKKPPPAAQPNPTQPTPHHHHRPTQHTQRHHAQPAPSPPPNPTQPERKKNSIS